LTSPQSKQRRARFQVSYRTEKNKLVPINDLIDWDKRKSNWVYTKRFFELQVANFWNRTPGEWDNIESEDEKAEMIATFNMKSMMSDYEAYLREKEFDRKNRSNRNIRHK
jgi:hypothetical protein